MSRDKKQRKLRKKEKVRVRQKSRAGKLVLAVALIFLLMILLLLGAFFLITHFGRANLKKSEDSSAPKLSEAVQMITEESQSDLEEGLVNYKGKKYRYNDDNLNFLCMGIDLENLDETEEDIFGGGGQADTIFLLSLDTRNQKLRIIAIPRDTIANIEIRRTDGSFVGMAKEQISTQYAYGDGKEESCELMVRAVSNLLYQLPIHGYCAIDMRAIKPLNRAVGGVRVSIEEDMTVVDPAFKKGAVLTLTDKQAVEYVRSRQALNQNGTQRLIRQRQYVLAYMDQAKAAMSRDMSFPIKLFQELKPYLVTSIGLDEITYLATQAFQASFSQEDLMVLEGESVVEDGYDAYHLSEDVLLDLIIDQFYWEEKEETR